jgi:uracil-DNA glycosylase family 4
MSEANPADNVDVTRQVLQQLDAYRAAGVEWLPKAAPLTVAAAPPAAAAASLFAAHDALVTPEADPLSDVGPRRQELTVLSGTVAKCVRCAALASTRRQTVFGVGPLDPDLCFIGEAPGADEDRQGEPFVGAAGQLLNRIIAACGLKREEVYICNILKCRPPGNRQPQPDEAHNCREYLDRQLELIRPRFLCALGACAAQNLLGVSTGIKRLRGTFHDYRGIPVLCTFHPAYLLRNPDAKKDVWEDMKKLLARMGRPLPGTKRE